MVQKLSQHLIIRYIVSGGIAAFVDLVMLYILNSLFYVHHIPASVVAFLTAFFVSFTLQKFWTFKNHSTDNIHKQLPLYLSVSLFGLGLNTFLMYVYVDLSSLSVMIAQIIAGFLVACCTFPLSQNVVFKKISI